MGLFSKKYSVDTLAQLAIDQWNKKIGAKSDHKKMLLEADIKGLEFLSKLVNESEGSKDNKYSRWLISEINQAIHTDLSRVMFMGSVSSCLALPDEKTAPKELRGLSTSESFHTVYMAGLRSFQSTPLVSLEDSIRKSETDSIINSDESTDKDIQHIIKTYDSVYEEYSDILINEKLAYLIKKHPELTEGIQLWFIVLLYATASLSNPSEESLNQPTNLMSLFLIKKYPISELSKVSDLISPHIQMLSDASESGNLKDYEELFSSCLYAYDENAKEYINEALTELSGEKLISVQEAVVNNFLLLWERINLNNGQ